MTPNDDHPAPTAGELRAKLNLETGTLSWPELQRHFARGVVIVVGNTLDLVEVAATFAEDDRPRAASWLDSGQVRRAEDADALRWQAGAISLWAVVVAPWVLVQESASR